MKVYYFENSGYNGVLLASDNKFIIYADMIDGLDINRNNIDKIAKNFIDAEFSKNDFDSLYFTGLDTLIYGEGVSDVLDAQNYFTLIYSK